MTFSVGQSLTNLHKEYSAFFFDDLVFSFLWSQIRIHVYQFLGGNEGNFFWQDLFNIIILYSHVFLCFAEYTVDRADCVDQSFHGTFFFGNDLFPVPLINIYRMDVVQVFITTDRDHICIKALAMSKAVFLQRIAFPFGKGMYDLSIFVLAFDVEAYRTFYTVKIVVQT